MNRTERINKLAELDKQIKETQEDIQFNKDEIVRDKSPFACVWKMERETKILQLKNDLVNKEAEFRLEIIRLVQDEQLDDIKYFECNSHLER